MTGSIRKLLNGFGFISSEEREKDLFFHAKDLEGVAFDDLNEGDNVSFEIGESPKGPKAEKVTVI